jgi:hypothetical protein
MAENAPVSLEQVLAELDLEFLTKEVIQKFVDQKLKAKHLCNLDVDNLSGIIVPLGERLDLIEALQVWQAAQLDGFANSVTKCVSEQHRESFLYVVHRTPFVNFLWALLDSAPSYDNLMSLLSSIGLISALLLSIVGDVHGMFSEEELDAANVKCRDFYSTVNLHTNLHTHGTFTRRWPDISLAFNALAASSTTYLMTSTLTVIILMLSLTTKDFGNGSSSEMRIWFYYANLPLCFAVIFLVIGLLDYMAVLEIIAAITIPTPNSGHACAWGQSPSLWFRWNEPHAYLHSFSICILIIPVLITVAAMGFAGG